MVLAKNSSAMLITDVEMNIFTLFQLLSQWFWAMILFQHFIEPFYNVPTGILLCTLVISPYNNSLCVMIISILQIKKSGCREMHSFAQDYTVNNRGQGVCYNLDTKDFGLTSELVFYLCIS